MALLLLLAASIRLFGLSTQSLWSDEGVTLLQAGAPTVAEVLQRVSQDTHPPLYFVMLHFWLGWFGSSEFALRLPSVLAALATFPLLARLLRRMELSELTVPSLAWLAISAFHCQYSQEARSHVFTALLATGSTLSAWSWLEERRLRAWPAWCAWNLVGLYFNPFFPLFWVASFSYLRSRRDAVPWLGGLVLQAAAFWPHLRTHLSGAHGFESQAAPGLVDALRLMQDLVFCHNYPNPQLSLQSAGPASGLPGLAVLLLALGGFVQLVRSGRGRAAGWLLTWSFGPIVLCFALVRLVHVDLLNFKYFVVSLPAVAALMADGLLGLGPLARTIVAVVLVVSNLISWGYRNFDPSFFNQDWRGVGASLQRGVAAGDLVIVQPQMMAPVLQYYLRGPVPLVAINESTELAGDPRLVRAARVWVVSVPAYRAVLRTNLDDSMREHFVLAQSVETRSYFQSEVLELSLWRSRVGAPP